MRCLADDLLEIMLEEAEGAGYCENCLAYKLGTCETGTEGLGDGGMGCFHTEYDED